MKSGLFIGGLALFMTLSVPAQETNAASTAALANEAADLPFDARHLTLYTTLFTVGLAIAMLVLMEVGRRVGTRHLTPDITESRKGLAAVDGAIFSLLGLLIAFSFHGAAEKFDTSRKLVIEEADCIDAAWMRLDLLPAEERPAMRDLFRQYVDARLATYRKMPQAGAVKAELDRSLKLQDEIWQRALGACRETSPACTHLIPALSQMFGVAHNRVASARIHPPKIIFLMLIALTLISAMLVGHGMAGRKSRSWTHVIGFVLTMAAAIYLIYELEYPRLGLVRIDTMDEVLVDLRHRMD